MNQVILIGRVGKDPDVKKVGQNNTSLASFSVATSKMVSKDNWVSTWHNIKCWSKTADYCEAQVRKGDEVFIQGEIETESWDDKNSGKKQYRTVVKADIVRVTQVATSKQDSGCEF